MVITDELRKRGLYDIAEDIARGLHLTVDEMFTTRRKPAPRARLSFYAYLRALGWSFPSIAIVSGKDHTTVMMALLAPEKRSAAYQRKKERKAVQP